MIWVCLGIIVWGFICAVLASGGAFGDGNTRGYAPLSEEIMKARLGE